MAVTITQARFAQLADHIWNWRDINPVLGQGQVGIELETQRIKIGDGSTDWNNLAYIATIPVTDAVNIAYDYKKYNILTAGTVQGAIDELAEILNSSCRKTGGDLPPGVWGPGGGWGGGSPNPPTPVFSGNTFDISAVEQAPTDIVFDGIYYWVTGQQFRRLSQLDSNFVPTGTNIPFFEPNNAVGIAWTGEYFWVLMDNGVASRYLPDGTQNLASDLTIGWPALGSSSSITYKYSESGGSLWVSDATQNEVREYDMLGVYTGNSFIVDTNYGEGIVWDGDQFWVLNKFNGFCRNYDASGTYLGIEIALAPTFTHTGVCWDGVALYMTNLSDASVYEYD